MNPWMFILIGGLFETFWAVTMNMSDGFTIIPWTVATLILLFISVLLLNQGLKLGLPVGASYSVWVGIGSIGSVVAGVLLFDESIGFVKVLLLALIIAGIVGLEHFNNDADKTCG